MVPRLVLTTSVVEGKTDGEVDASVFGAASVTVAVVSSESSVVPRLGGHCNCRGDRCGCRLCRGLCGGSLIRGRIDALTTTRLCTVPCHVFPVRLARSHVGPVWAKSVTINAWAGKHVGGLQQQSKQNKTRHFSKISLFDHAGFEPKCFWHQWQSMVCRK